MSADNVIYNKNGFRIISVGNEYIAVNGRDFKSSHTHLKSYDQAIYVISMVANKRMPRHLSNYLLTSLIRLSKDDDYKDKISSLIERRESKKRGNRGYCNSPCYC